MIDWLQDLTGEFLTWIISVTSYKTGLLFKDSIADILSGITGFIIAIIFFAFISKDTRIVSDPNATRTFITKIKKNKQTKLFITIPACENGHMPTIKMIALFLNMAFVRCTTIKQLQFVNKKSIYICFWVLFILTLVFFILSVSIDLHVILPDSHGGYYVKY